MSFHKQEERCSSAFLFSLTKLTLWSYFPFLLLPLCFAISALQIICCEESVFVCLFLFPICLETNTSVVHDPSSMKSVHDDTYGCPIGIKLLKTYINVCFQILYLLPHRTNLNSTRSPRPRNSSAQDHS